MIRVRCALRMMLLVLVAAFALPAGAAPDKIYSLNMSPVALPEGATTVTAVFRNEVPNGNSSFNSLTLTAPAGVTIPTQTITVPSGNVVISGNVIRISNISPVKPQRTFAFSFTVNVAAGTACGTGTWASQAFTGSSFSGDTFALQTAISSIRAAVGCDGILNCENAGTPFAFGDAQAGGTRGDNKDGSACIPVAYDFTNDIADSNSVMLKWDTGTQPDASFSYSATWKPEFVDPVSGLPTRKTKIAWEFDGGGNPINIVTGRACLSDELPAPYGTLIGAIGSGNTTIFVNTTATLPAVPFPIVIGNERMNVTAVSGTDYSVTRGVGGTAAAAHPAGANVMSTPLPIDNDPASFYFGRQHRVCIWHEEWISFPAGLGSPDCTPLPSLPQACVQYRTSVFDIGDGWLSRQ